MRDIKFRAWDTTINNFWYNIQETSDSRMLWNFVTLPPFKPYCLNPFFRSRLDAGIGFHDDKIILQQFTGIKDRNGKEIYEGDLIKHGDDDGVYYEVFYHDDQGRFCLNRTHYQGSRCGCYIPEITSIVNEVIGNIYKNPELLKGDTNVE